ncbi:MAG TPA: twin-arginine translocation signal domain-containing protein, partial [Terriglobales bacterium]|nr:twin-arginine translocation signal domain-containing protein [Terriglobales bacterium]
MSVNRRRFLERTAATAAALTVFPPAWGFAPQGSTGSDTASAQQKPYGSGYFGVWIEDEFGLPAFRYTCDQLNDPKAKTEVNPGVLGPTEHIHQVGNDRLVAIASNFGTVRVRQDEGAPKFLNDFAPGRGQFAGGFGYLADGTSLISTFYPGNAKSFDRTFGAGYFRKKVTAGNYAIDQVIFAPFGDDPVLVSQVTLTNSGPADAALRWIEYWGCQPYQFSFRAFMESFAGKGMHELRRDFANRFEHRFRKAGDGSGLLESKDFLGRDPAEERQFQGMVAYLEKNPNPFLTAPEKNVPRQSAFEDLDPPPTFLISLDAPADGMSTNGKDFFGAGGVNHPGGLGRPLDGDLSKTGPESALLLERRFTLKPRESRTLTFLYGYLTSGFDLDSLISKYRKSAATALRDSSAQWKKHGLRFSTPEEPWVEREVTWNHYYLRSGFTYDDFFHQRILSQASIYQYVMGFQGAARDPLQHVLPFIFSDPDLVKEVLRYTLKEVRPDGSIPYGIAGHGMPMPTTSDNSSDMPLWLLWAVSEYVLATRDVQFLDSDVVTVFGASPGAEHWQTTRAPVRGLLARCYKHLIEDVKTGDHGLMRMLQDDWNDALVNAWVPQQDVKECVEKSESVLNSAMASYVFDYYARMLTYAGDDGRFTIPIQRKAEEHRNAVRAQWTGKWFRRAWLGAKQGWLGEKGMWIEPQPWALISRIPNQDQTHALLQSIDQELRRPSPIGAMQISDSPDRAGSGVWKMEPGTSVAGGVWPSLNQTLVWALASLDGAMAWDEWKKNSFARHAEVYPDIWYGTWSGPDVLNSVSSKHPGAATGGQPFGWTDFPVLNMHTHACPLYSAAKLIGVDFTESGVALAPKLPLASFRFESPLLGLVKSSRGYEGWYNPSSRNTWSIRLNVEE